MSEHKDAYRHGERVKRWLGEQLKTPVPRSVATCPACGGTLSAEVQEYGPYDGRVHQVGLLCTRRQSEECAHDISWGIGEGEAIDAIDEAGQWVIRHVRCACYIRKN